MLSPVSSPCLVPSQVEQRQVSIAFQASSSNAVPLTALNPNDDDSMIGLIVALAVLFLLAMIALMFRVCTCFVEDDYFPALGVLPSSNYVIEEFVDVVARDSTDVESVDSDDSYISEVVTEYDDNGTVLRQTHQRIHGGTLPSRASSRRSFVPLPVAAQPRRFYPGDAPLSATCTWVHEVVGLIINWWSASTSPHGLVSFLFPSSPFPLRCRKQLAARTATTWEYFLGKWWAPIPARSAPQAGCAE